MELTFTRFAMIGKLGKLDTSGYTVSWYESNYSEMLLKVSYALNEEQFLGRRYRHMKDSIAQD